MVRRRKCMVDDPDQDIGDQEGHADNIECAMSPERSEVHNSDTVTISLCCTRTCETK